MITVAMSSHWTISVGGAGSCCRDNWSHPPSTLSICYWCGEVFFVCFVFVKLQKVTSEMFCQRCAQWTNYLEKLKEDLDDNDAGAIITDVWTGGVLLAKQYIRTSLIIPMLTYILSPEELATECCRCSKITHTRAHTRFIFFNIYVEFFGEKRRFYKIYFAFCVLSEPFPHHNCWCLFSEY